MAPGQRQQKTPGVFTNRGFRLPEGANYLDTFLRIRGKASGRIVLALVHETGKVRLKIGMQVR